MARSKSTRKSVKVSTAKQSQAKRSGTRKSAAKANDAHPWATAPDESKSDAAYWVACSFYLRTPYNALASHGMKLDGRNATSDFRGTRAILDEFTADGGLQEELWEVIKSWAESKGLVVGNPRDIQLANEFDYDPLAVLPGTFETPDLHRPKTAGRKPADVAEVLGLTAKPHTAESEQSGGTVTAALTATPTATIPQPANPEVLKAVNDYAEVKEFFENMIDAADLRDEVPEGRMTKVKKSVLCGKIAEAFDSVESLNAIWE